MTKTIASSYFEALKAERPLYRGLFEIPAVPKGGKPVLLTINDHVQYEQQPHTMGGGQKPRTIFGEEIAGDLFKFWTQNTIGMGVDCGPGVWIVRDMLPVLDEKGNPIIDAERSVTMRPATDEERKAMWDEDFANAIARQDRWAELSINNTDALLAENPANIRWVGTTPRASCAYMGREREWQYKLKAEDTKTCLFCTKSIPSATVKCPHCNEIVDRKRYDELTAKMPLAPPVKVPAKEANAA